MASVVQTERYLVIDIGHVFTRAFLFDVVDGRYHLVGQSAVLSTWEAPVRDVREGVLSAVEALEQIAGLRLIEEGDILTPTRVTGEGVDKVFVVTSAGRPLRMTLMGILETLSLRSALRAIEPFPVEPVVRFHINDGLTEIRRLEHLLNAAPDVVLLVGGTDQGARQALLDYVHILELAAPLFPRGGRPVVLYAGNAALASQVQETLGGHYEVLIAHNVRPALERESLYGLRRTLQSLYRQHVLRQIPGLDGLLNSAHGFEPVPLAWRRMLHVLAAYYRGLEGYLGVHIGSGLSFFVRGSEEEVHLRCFPYGLGHGLKRFWEDVDEELLRLWTPDLKDPMGEVLHKMAYPELAPETEAEAWLEWGLAFQMGRKMLLNMLPGSERRAFRRQGLPTHYRMLFLGGAVWSALTRPEALVLTALDLFQPVGVVTLVADVAHLAAPLGILSKVNPYVTVHMLRSAHFVPLATVVTPWGYRPRGRDPIARARLQWAPNQQMSVDLHPGEIQVLRLPPGYHGDLTVEPVGPFDVGAGPGRTLHQEVRGSWLGVVLDGRGRPLRYPSDPGQHREARQTWLRALMQEA